MKKKLFTYIFCILSLSLISLSGGAALNSTSKTSEQSLNGIRHINQSSEVTYFFKYGTGVVVAQCVQYTGLNNLNDCKIKTGTSVNLIEVQELKNRLFTLIKNSSDIISQVDVNTEKKINAFKKIGVLDSVKLKELQSLQNFIQRQGPQNVDAELINRLQELKDAGEINSFINKLTNQISINKGIKEYIFAKHKDNLMYKLLESYTQLPGFFQDFVTVPVGAFKNIKIDKEFSIQYVPVTQYQYAMVMKDNPTPGKFICPSNKMYIEYSPVCPNAAVIESGEQKKEYLKMLNAADPNYSYRLPTADELEYAYQVGAIAIMTNSFGQLEWVQYQDGESTKNKVYTINYSPEDDQKGSGFFRMARGLGLAGFRLVREKK